MLAYRSESALYNNLADYYKYRGEKGWELLKEIFTSDADMIPDYQKQNINNQSALPANLTGKPHGKAMVRVSKPN